LRSVKIEYTRAARKSLLDPKVLPAPRRRQLSVAIEKLAADPTGAGLDVKPLAGRALYRLRVGSYRVLYSIDLATDTIGIELIRTRGDVYDR
jgi:mRNA interferase RelE/StbE